MDFALRYLGSVDAAELQAILDAGLAFMPVTFCRGAGWAPSAALGTQDGKQAATRLGALGIPKGTTVWLDVEGPGGTFHDVIDFINAWAHEVRAAGFDPGLYVGAGAMLTSGELYGLAVDRYWHSCSRVVDRDGKEVAPACGWTMIQVVPGNVTVAGVEVDIDFIQQDYRGRLPTWVVG